MNEIANNLRTLAEAIEHDRGELDFLALFQREGHSDWELVFGAPWVANGLRNSIGYVGERAAELLTKEESAGITSIVIIDHAIDILSSQFGGPGEYGNFLLNGVPIARAIIVRMNPPSKRRLREEIPVSQPS